MPGLFSNYIQPQKLPGEEDVIGCSIDLEEGVIQYYLNGEPLGIAFNEGPSLKKYKLYPFLQAYKCRVSIF